MATSRATILADIHRAAGAEFMDVCGTAVPAHFGDPEAEYRAAREGTAIFDAGFLPLVSATGKDVLDYLNRRLSQRVVAMQPGDVLRACQLGAEGRMQADMDVYREGERTWLLGPPAMTGEGLRALADMYVFSEDAKFVDESAGWTCFAVVGRQSSVVGDIPLTTSDQRPTAFLSSQLFGSMAVLVPAERAADAWAQLAKAATPIGFLAFDTLRVEAGEPWFGIDTDERTIPLEAGLERAIHFNKGCYPGQETIARITNLGHPARQMLGVRWNSEDPPPAGPIFVGEAEAGRLTSSTYSPRLAAAIGLAMMKWAHRAPGTSVHTADGTAGTLVALPFNWTPA